MKRIFLLLITLFCVMPVMAQSTMNDKADNIMGIYIARQGDDNFKAKIVKLTDGTYRGQIIWLENDKDANGNKILDSKNPDKSLRSKPADQAVLFSCLKYDAKKHCWNDTKIYDPQRGLKAHMIAEFTQDGRLKIKGSLLGISEIVYWERVDK